MNRLILINILIFFLETLVIYEYFKYHSADQSALSVEDNHLRGKLLVSPNALPPPIPYPMQSSESNAEPEHEIETQKELPEKVNEGEIVDDRSAEVLEEGKKVKCSNCRLLSVTAESDVFESVQASPNRSSTFLLFTGSRPSINGKDIALYSTKFHPNGVKDAEARYFLEPSKVDLPLDAVFETTKSVFGRVEYVVHAIDCLQLVDLCWKFQVNHHPLPLYLTMSQSSPTDETNFMRITSNSTIQIPVPDRNYTALFLAPPVPPAGEGRLGPQIPLPSAEQLAMMQAAHNQQLDNIISSLDPPLPESLRAEPPRPPPPPPPPIPQLPVDPLLTEEELRDLVLKGLETNPAALFPHGIYFYKKTKLIKDITDQDIFLLLNDSNTSTDQQPIHPTIVYVYSHLCKPCKKYHKTLSSIIEETHQIIGNYNAEHNDLQEQIPFISFLALNIEHFAENSILRDLFSFHAPTYLSANQQKKNPFGDLPRLFVFHMRSVQKRVVDAFSVWNPALAAMKNVTSKDLSDLHRAQSSFIDSPTARQGFEMLTKTFDVEEIPTDMLKSYLQMNYFIFTSATNL